jgi:pimeloyl-ACP methyl ester carboxylesterase
MWNAISIAAAAALLAGLLYAAIGAWRDRHRFMPPGRLVRVGGHRLHYRCAGAGAPAVILEAGIAASSVTWSLVQPRVAEMTRVCSYDRAGLAWSDFASSARSIDRIAEELHVMLEQADIPPPYLLVAHSFGALVIRAFARAWPHEVAGLVFVDPLHPEEWCAPSPQQRRMLRGAVFFSRLGAALAAVGIVRLSLTLLSGGAPAAPRRFSRVFGGTVAAMLERLVGEVRKLPSDVLPSVQAHWSNPKAFRAMRQHLAAMPACSADLMRTADAFADIPVAVLSGGTRAPRWLAADAALAAASTRGRHAVSQKSGHWIHLDDPDLVIEAIRDIAEGRNG